MAMLNNQRVSLHTIHIIVYDWLGRITAISVTPHFATGTIWNDYESTATQDRKARRWGNRNGNNVLSWLGSYIHTSRFFDFMIFLRKKKLLATATSRPQRNFSTKLPATLPIPCCLIRSQCSVPIEATVAARKPHLLPQIHMTMNLWPINRSTTGVYQQKTDEHGDKPDKPNWSCVIHARF